MLPLRRLTSQNCSANFGALAGIIRYAVIGIMWRNFGVFNEFRHLREKYDWKHFKRNN